MTLIDPHSQQFTDDAFVDEKTALADLDMRLAACDLFHVSEEVEGYPTQPRFEAELKELRIDRLLIPKAKLLDAGWKNGIVGIEAKKGGHKLGALVNQAADYTRAVWRMKKSGNAVVATWVFIWPCEKVYGDAESFMATNRIGVAFPPRFGQLVLQVCATNMLRVNEDGSFSCKTLNPHRKAGSR